MNLFQWGNFTLSSGQISPFKIDCDALTEADWRAVAQLILAGGVSFREVLGVASGGLPLAFALRPFCTPGVSTILLVDDVLTTGASLERLRAHVEDRERVRPTTDGPTRCEGVVLFARRLCPFWVRSLFQMSPSLLAQASLSLARQALGEDGTL